MIRFGVWILALLLGGQAVAGDGAAPAAGSDRPRDRQQIRQHIDSIFKAYMDKDRDAVRATHSADWIGFLRTSTSTIKGIDAYMRTAEQALGGPSRIRSYEMLEFDVAFYGDVALVPYIAEMVVEIAGQTFPSKLRVLDIYAKRDGHWIQVASHTTEHPDTEAARRQWPAPVPPALRRQILDAREAVWRAWFAGDQDELDRRIPEEAIAINAGEDDWQDRARILRSSSGFAGSGARLVRLEFPRTEIQLYRDVAILYTTYVTEVEDTTGRHTSEGRATEIFVRREGTWVNTGWHLDSGG